MLFFSFPGLSWFLLYTQLCPPGYTSSGNVLIQRRHLQHRVGLRICFLLTYFSVLLLIMKVYPTQRIHSFSVVQRSSSRLIKVKNSDSFGKWMKTIELILKTRANKNLALSRLAGPVNSFDSCSFNCEESLTVGYKNFSVMLSWKILLCLLKLPSQLWMRQEWEWSQDPVTSSKSSFTKQLCSNATVVFWFIWTWAMALIKLN